MTRPTRNPFDGHGASAAAPMRTLALPAALLLLVLAPLAGAHGPPAKRDQDFRLLADHNDDCGGDSGALPNCRGSHDLIGLDVLERHDGGLGDVVVFRFFLNGGSGSLKDVLTLKADGAAKSFELRTSDNKRFEGSGFDAVGPPVDLNDNGRFLVEASVRLSTLGGPGVRLTDYRVEASSGAAKGDVMPGCYHNALDQRVPDSHCSGTAENPDTVHFVRTTGYALTGPTYYATVTLPASVQVPADGEEVVEVRLATPFRNTAQLATLTVEGADGFTATWVGANGAAPAEEDLLKGGSATAELRLRGDGHDPATGTLTLTVSTSLGGRSVHTLPYEIVGTPPPTGTPSGDPGGAGGSKDSPPPAAALLSVGLLALARLRRNA